VAQVLAGTLTFKPENRCVVVTEAGSYVRLIDFCITQLKAQGPSRTCNESKEEEERGGAGAGRHADVQSRRLHPAVLGGSRGRRSQTVGRDCLTCAKLVAQVLAGTLTFKVDGYIQRCLPHPLGANRSQTIQS